MIRSTLQKIKKTDLSTGKSIAKNIIRTFRIYGSMLSKARLIWILVSTILLAITPFLSTWLNGKLINETVKYVGGNADNLNLIYQLFGWTIVVSLFIALWGLVNSYLTRLIYYDWHERFTHIIIEKISGLDMEKFENPEFHTLLNKVKDGYTHRPGNFAMDSITLISDVISIITSLFIIIALSPILLPIIFIISLPEFLITLKGSKLKWGIWQAKGEVNKHYGEVQSSLISERYNKEIRILGARSYLLNLAFKLKKEFIDEQRNILKKENKPVLFARILDQLAFAAIEFWLLLKVLKRSADFGIGDYNFYLSTINRFSSASQGLLRKINRIYDDNLYMTELYKFLDVKNEMVSLPDAVVIPVEKTPSIEFKNVSFKYPGSKEYIYKNFSIKINSGEDVALVGENGAGKTTFVKLLCRFYDPQEGEILVNGHNLKEIDLESWYRNLGVLFQDFNRYGFTARDNIRIGDVNKPNNFKKIKEAAFKSGADKVISKLALKYKQLLSKWFEKGADLSGGEWQRIALARAFFRDSNILILDEPTSAIDAVAEYEIFNKITEMQEDKTTIIISHRFSTVRNADKIFVIENGQIVESGSHETLMEEKGIYKKMFDLQAEGYK